MSSLTHIVGRAVAAFVLALALTGARPAMAVPLAGTYVIGSGGDFATIAAATAALTANGVSAPASFLIKTGTYSEALVLGAVAGASAVNRIRFVAQSGNPADVVLTVAPVGSGMVQLNGAQYLDLDSLTLASSAFDVTGGRLVTLSGTAKSDRFQGCVLNCLGAPASVTGITCLAGTSFDSLVVSKCQISVTGPGSWAITLGGSSASGVSIVGNTLAIAGNSNGIVLQAPTSTLTIQGNVIGMSASGVGITLSSAASGVVRGNRVTGAAGGISMTNGFVANNMLSAGGNALALNSPTAVTVVFNTFVSTASSAAILVSSPSAGAVTLTNNIASCPGGATPLSSNVSTSTQFAASDYNDFQTSGATEVNLSSSLYATVTAWSAATGFDTHSLSTNPGLLSATDLHATAPSVNNAGTPLGSVLDDFDGQVRSLATPDIGADEFTPVSTPLAGLYTIGTGGDFLSMSAATTALLANGVSGPASFLIKTGTYDEPTVLSAIPGANPVNRVRFVAQSGNAAEVTLTYTNTAVATDGVIQLVAAQYVDFDSLTITAASAASIAHQTLVWMSGTTRGNRFQGCLMNTAGPNRNGFASTAGTFDSLVISGCQIQMPGLGSRPLLLQSPTLANGVAILNNVITAATTTGNGIYVGSPAAGFLIQGNTISLFSGNGTGIQFAGTTASMVIRANRITGTSTGINLIGSGLVANNMVQAVNYSLVLGNPTGMTVAFNSFASSGTTPAITVNNGGAATLTLTNNVLACTGGGVPLSSSNSSFVQIAASDYNDFYTTGATPVAILGTNYNSLAAWRSATGFDTHSLSVNPGFVSTTDLHATASAINNAGTPLAAVLDDIDGEPRSASTPDLGADEFNSLLAPLAGTYVVGATGAYATPAAAAADVSLRGVAGPVSFLIQTGTYSGTVLLTPIAGASAVNRVRFVAQSGNAADVTLSGSAVLADGTDANVRLDGARYVDFDSLGISASVNSNNGGLAWMIHGAMLDRFQGVSFTSTGLSRSCIRSNGANVDSLAVTDCQFQLPTSFCYAMFFTGGGTSDGLLFQGNTVVTGNASCNGLYLALTGATMTIAGNTFTMVGGGAMSVSGTTSLTCRANKITGSATGIALQSGTGGVIVNNMVQATTNALQASTPPSLTVAFNTLHSNGASAAVNINANTGTVTLRNNVIAATSGSLLLSIGSGSAAPFATSDYNDFYTTGADAILLGATSYGSLAAWRSATGLDSHSVSANPGFVSATDLHASAPALNNAGSPFGSVLDDIDGQPRSASTPDIGADEFNTSLIPLAGTYVVGATGTYATPAAAVSDVVLRGVSAPVSFLIQPGTYNGTYSLTPITGANSVNRVRFVSLSGSAADVTLQAPVLLSDGSDAVFRLDGARYVDLDSLTLFAIAGSNSGTFVYLQQASRVDRIQGCVLQTTGAGRYGIRGSVTAIDSFEVRGCQFLLQQTSCVGMNISGSGTNAGMVIQGNTISTAAGSNYGVILQQTCTGAVIRGNTFNLSSGIALYLTNAASFTVQGNRISGSDTGIDIETGAGGLIANNMVQVRLIALAFNGGLATTLAYNSFLNTATSACISVVGALANRLTLANNIFACPGGAAPLTLPANGASIFASSDYNDFYTLGATVASIGGTNYGTLGAYRVATGLEAHSVAANPGYLSATDLHAQAPGVNNAGTPVASVLDDFDGEARNASTPDIGADEFTGVLSPLAGTYTVGATGAYATPAAAAADLCLRGISAAVSFLIQSGTYTGTSTLTPIAGANAANRVRFVAQSGNAADVTLTTPSLLTDGSDAVMRYDGARYLDVDSLTLQATGVGNVAAIVWMTHSSTMNRFQGCVFSSPGQNHSGIRASAGSIDSLVVSNCQFLMPSSFCYAISTVSTGTAEALAFVGNNVAMSGGTALNIGFNGANLAILNNAFTLGGGAGISLTGPSSATVRGNRMYAAGTGISYGAPVTGLIANNMVQGANNALSLTAPTSVTVVFNSLSGTGNPPTLNIANGSVGAVTLKDNVISNSSSGAPLNCSSSANVLAAPDYNDYFAAGATLARFGATSVTTLPALQVQTGGDAHSLNVAPAFTSVTDLHTSAPGLDGAGTPVAGVLDDIDGQLRNAVTPDIGADEFTNGVVDNTPPGASFTSGPADGGWTNTASPAFGWIGADDISVPATLRYETSLDGAAFSAPTFSTSGSFGPLSEGPHTLAVVAIDQVGNIDPTPATRTFTVDLTAPDTQILTGPGEGSTIPTTTADFTVGGTDNLAPAGQLTFSRRFDGGAYTATTSSTAISLTGLANGAHTLDVRAQDEAGNVDATPATRHFSVLIPVAPKPVIVAGPPAAGYSGASTVFTWTLGAHSAPVANITYASRLDAAATTAFGPDTTLVLAGLAAGPHTLWVIARDTDGLRDSTSRAWTVDVTPPTVAISGGPLEGGWSTASPVFAWTGSDNLTSQGQLRYAYAVDGGAFTAPATATGATLGPLASGPHTLAVHSLDLAGNPSADAVRHWSVDIVAPQTAITGGPANSSMLLADSVSYAYSGTDDQTAVAGLQYQSRLDGGAWTAASSATARTLTALSDGSHLFEARAVDAGGNADATPDSRSFTVDAQGPVITLTSGPAANACVTTSSVGFTWTASDVVTPAGSIVYAWQVDGGAPTAFGPGAGATPGGLLEGLHTFTVQARDGSGHVTSLARPFRVDFTLPVVNAPTTHVLDASHVRVQCTGTDLGGVTSFRVQVGTDPVFGSVAADVSVSSTGTYDFTGTAGLSYYARAQAIDCAGNTSAFSGPSNVAILANLPNLVVTNVTAAPSATAGQSTTIHYTVSNIGVGPTNTASWVETIYLSPSPVFDPGSSISLPQRTNLSQLAPGESYTGTATVTLPVGTSGTRYLVVVADGAQAVAESNKGDNAAASAAIAVTLGTVADLHVIGVVAPPTALSSDSIEVRWTVRNDGSGRTDATQWYDTVFLSTDPVFDYSYTLSGGIRVGDLPLGAFQHTGALDPAASYQAIQRVKLPANFGGTRYVLVASDLYAGSQGQLIASDAGAVFENGSEINTGGSDSLVVTPELPADLQVEAVAAPDTGASGSTLAVSFTVGNHGFNPTALAAAWSDKLWLSTDAVLDPGDLLLATYPHSASVPLSGQYTVSANVALPVGVSGAYRLIVETDANHQLVEYLENNNTLAKATPVSIRLSPWANLVAAGDAVTDTVPAGGSGTASWHVTNAGSGSASGSWTDRVELGTSPVWTTGLQVVGSQRGTHALGPAQDYPASVTIGAPQVAGTYYAFAHADAAGEVYENMDEADDVALIGTVVVTPHPPVDLAISGLTVPATATAGQPLAISWTVTNQGAGPTLASFWSEDAWLSLDGTVSADDVRLTAPGHSGAVVPGGHYTPSLGSTLPPGLSGTYHVIARSDPSGTSGDAILANNTVVSAGTVTVTAPPAPQLTVPVVSVAANLTAGQPVQVSFDVHNAGAGPVPNSTWFTAVYLSQDPWVDGSDVLLGTVPGPAGFAAGATDHESLTGSIPAWVSGANYLIVVTDSRGDVYEAGAENDNTAYATTQVTLPPPADLVVQNVQVPPAAAPGQPMTVTYTLANQGLNPAVGQVQNAVYVSADASFASANDPLVGVEVTNINIPPGGVQQLSAKVVPTQPLQVDALGNVTALLPPISPGPYFAIVHANIRDNIRELVTDNNSAASAATVQTDVPALTLGVPEPMALTAQQALFYKVTVPAGLDLRLALGTNVPDATNAVFVAFGRTPTEADFDYTQTAGFTATPVVLVPQTQAGTYFVMVLARGLGAVANSESATLLAQTLPFSLSAIAPAVGGAGGQVTVHVTGAALREATIFRLEQSGIVRAVATLVTYTNSTDLRTRFNLGAVAPGVYDFVAANGASTVVLPNAFVVEPARPMAMQVQTSNPDVLRRSAVGNFTIKLVNTSNQDEPVVAARVLFPATSQLRTLAADPGLRTLSQLVPGRAAVSGDVIVLHHAAGGDSLAAVDVVGANFSPGESRTLTLGISGFDTSPYSIRVLAAAMPALELLNRRAAELEAVRRALVSAPAGLPDSLVLLANDAFAFRDSALRSTYVLPGLVTDDDLALLQSVSGGLIAPQPFYGQSSGPQVLLDSLAVGGPCPLPGPVPECKPDVARPGTAMPACRVVYDDDAPCPLRSFGGLLARTPGTTIRGYEVTVTADVRVVVPCDPNLMTGPGGFGPEHWVGAGASMQYRVDFENLPGVASAPAQVVKVTVPIDPALDITSFRLGDLGFGPTSLVAMGSQRTSYSGQGVYSDLGLAVRITAGINPVTRLASWTFTTIDPATGQQPVNPYVGFLPVNDAFGSGTGFVTYTAAPAAGLASGATASAQATIQFDVNAPLATTTATNRIDTRPPVSLVLSGVEILDSTRVRVHWTETDDTTGAGLAGASLYMSADAGAFTAVGTAAATGNQLVVPVLKGHQYGFYSRASDNAGNSEPPKSSAEAHVTIGSQTLDATPRPPRVTMLYANFPNPFRASTSVRFDLAGASPVTLDVFDVQGRRVLRILDGKRFEAGRHAVELKGLPSGPAIYFYRLRAGSFEQTRRMVSLR